MPLERSFGRHSDRVGYTSLDDLLSQICPNGADAVVLNKGSLGYARPQWFAKTALVIHLGTAAVSSPKSHAFTEVKHALKLCADCVSVDFNLGSTDERRQLEGLVGVAKACEHWNLPLLAMVSVVGPRVTRPTDLGLIAHAVSLAAELGADMVLIDYLGSLTTMAEVAEASPIPILVNVRETVGSDSELLSHASDLMRSGVGGIALGLQALATNPGVIVPRISEIVHHGAERARVHR